ncbi:MAG TPA: hypothetical protein VJA22_00515 [Patescibacteria group bacterium]|nr:hypothetical protein [Patescibacteria group bacterium]
MNHFSKQLELADGEDVMRIIRRSPWSYISRYFLVLLLGLIPIFFIIPLFYSGRNGILIFSLSLLLAILILFRVLWSIYRNALVLTNLNIIDVDKKKLFRKKITKFSLQDVEEVRVVKKGLRPKFFNYGNVVFRISSVNGSLILKYVGDPEYVKDLIVATIETSDDQIIASEEEQTRPSDEKMIKMMRKIRTTVGGDHFEELLAQVYEEDIS